MANETMPAFVMVEDTAVTHVFPVSDRPGRWTSGQLPVIYAACSAAAAMLEHRAHLESTPVNQLKLIEARVPSGSLHVIEVAEDLLWRERPYRTEVQALGDAWLATGNTLAAQVPSALCPCEHNLLLNPRHPLFTRISYLAAHRFRMDQRLG
ncbi:RES family NAD+ phosphorylase [Pseudoxanthomonas sp. 22568]|uniref:RES family NAD+ phosphorylase n=1 Tax=Pseudoxanthomonas sp. 22568 TaxID=3453945 RepID=UPI00296F16AF|nr:RES family NAD+ phosphorylase [Pseudoxanthomonas japonensis]